ncbi:hypothetical protein FHS82_001108 [Pseudochelatococcus lubricantis]|uniref:Uncharacterized protein n=1 Tax=Pseudochelatococcus lubricantis TaxID=1538102 RepID=A0ABX0UWZ9_9HYPH|nr:hypothetical protein [Pseudochelatococcus lubricantis]NIJ57282.1 hypothetical protein [Pseudochelatococcus lubricantis]
MTRLTWFLARHALIGFSIAALFAGMLFGLDVAGLHTLVAASPVGMVAAGALTFLLCLTFGSIQMGIAVMQLEERDTPPRGRRLRLAPVPPRGGLGAPVPVRVTVDARRR